MLDGRRQRSVNGALADRSGEGGLRQLLTLAV
jgi:hypothetical protein